MTTNPFARPSESARLVLFFVLLIILHGCSDPPLPHEQAIEMQLNKAISAIESLNTSDLFDVLSEDFDIQGNFSRGSKASTIDEEKIKQQVMLLRLRKQSIAINITGLEIKLDNYNSHLASMKANVLVTGGRGLLPDDGRLFVVTGTWRLYDDEWKITQLTWQ